MKSYKLENILSHREQGLSWRDIGRIYAEEGEEPSVIGERIRGTFRKYRSKTQRCDAKGDYTSSRELFDATDLTPDALLERHGYDPTLFTLVDSTAYLTETGVRSRIRVTPRLEPFATESFVEAIRDASKGLPSIIRPEHVESASGTILVPLYDLHYGKAPSDTAKGLSIGQWLDNMTKTLTDKRDEYKRCVILIGQDLFNVDTYNMTTTKGTQQRQFTPPEEMFKDGFKAMLDFIRQALESYRDVEVIFTYGNHDRLLGYAAAVALEEIFKSDALFVVETSPRIYRVYDGVCVGITHGADIKRLGNLMAHEAPMLWATAHERIWVTGHYHQLTVSEEDGITHIGVPSPSLQDDWHRDHGYIARPRGCVIGLKGGELSEIRMV